MVPLNLTKSTPYIYATQITVMVSVNAYYDFGLPSKAHSAKLSHIAFHQLATLCNVFIKLTLLSQRFNIFNE